MVYFKQVLFMEICFVYLFTIVKNYYLTFQLLQSLFGRLSAAAKFTIQRFPEPIPPKENNIVVLKYPKKNI